MEKSLDLLTNSLHKARKHIIGTLSAGVLLAASQASYASTTVAGVSIDGSCNNDQTVLTVNVSNSSSDSAEQVYRFGVSGNYSIRGEPAFWNGGETNSSDFRLGSGTFSYNITGSPEASVSGSFEFSNNNSHSFTFSPTGCESTPEPEPEPTDNPHTVSFSLPSSISDSDESAGESYIASASFNDPENASASSIQWYVNGSLQSSGSLSPTLNLQDGSNTVRVEITVGEHTVSQTDSTTVDIYQAPVTNQSPSVTLNCPTSVSDTDKSDGEDVTCSVSATDSDGTVQSLVYSLSPTFSSSTAISGGSFTTRLPDGNTTVYVRATDDDGATDTASDSTTVNAYVPPSSNQRPNVTLSCPSTVLDTNEEPGEFVTCSVSATDSDGTIESLIWSLNSAFNGSAAITGDSFTVGLSDGTSTVYVEAKDDDDGTTTVSQQVTVDFYAPEPVVQSRTTLSNNGANNAYRLESECINLNVNKGNFAEKVSADFTFTYNKGFPIRDFTLDKSSIGEPSSDDECANNLDVYIGNGVETAIFSTNNLEIENETYAVTTYHSNLIDPVEENDGNFVFSQLFVDLASQTSQNYFSELNDFSVSVEERFPESSNLTYTITLPESSDNSPVVLLENGVPKSAHAPGTMVLQPLEDLPLGETVYTAKVLNNEYRTSAETSPIVIIKE